MARLTDTEIQAVLAAHVDWKIQNRMLTRELTFPTFMAAIQFVNGAAELAEEADHHPDIDIRYNKVKLALISHDKGGLTSRDVKMVGKLDDLLRDLPSVEN